MIYCYDETTKRMIGRWRCIELPVYGEHDGRWVWEDL